MSDKWERIIEIASQLNTIRNIDELAKEILRAAMDIVEGEASSIFLLKDNHLALELYSALGAGADKMPKTDIPIEGSIAGKAFSTQEISIVNNVQEDAEHCKHIDDVTGYRTQSIIAVPLVIDDDCLGVFEVLNKKNGQAFNEKDAHYLRIFSCFMASSLYNLQLFRNLQEKTNTINELIDAMPEGVVLLDAGFQPLRINQAFRSVFSIQDVSDFRYFKHKHRFLYNIIHEIMHYFSDESVDTVRLQNGKNHIEFFVSALKPMLFQLWCSATQLIHQGKRRGVIISFRNVSQDREATREKSKILAIMAHRMHFPLQRQKKYISLLYHLQTPLPVPMNDFIKETGMHEQLVDNLVNYSDLSAGSLRVQLRPYSLVTVCADFQKHISHPCLQGMYSIVMEFVPDVTVLIDPDVLINVWKNLVITIQRLASRNQQFVFMFENLADIFKIKISFISPQTETDLSSPFIFDMRYHLERYFNGQSADLGFDFAFPYAHLAMEALHGLISLELDQEHGVLQMILNKG